MYVGILLKHFLPIERKFKLLLFIKCKNQIKLEYKGTKSKTKDVHGDSLTFLLHCEEIFKFTF